MHATCPSIPAGSEAVTSTSCELEFRCPRSSVLVTDTVGPEHSTLNVLPLTEDVMPAGLLAETVAVYWPAPSHPAGRD